MVLEDGTGLSTSNSYASETTLGTYSDDRGIELASGDAEAALVRATAWVDNTYRARFPGYKVKLRGQALEWPRACAYDSACNLVAPDAVPVEIVNATCEAAIRELAEAGSLAPDLDREAREIAAGSVRIVYSANSKAQTTFQIIDGILAGLLGSPNGFTARAVRG